MINEVEIMRKITYTLEELRKIVRMEDLGSEIWEAAEEKDIICDGVYDITLDDIEAALNRISEEKLPAADVLRWHKYLRDTFRGHIGPEDIMESQYKPDHPVYKFPDSERNVLAFVMTCADALSVEIKIKGEDKRGDQLTTADSLTEYIRCFRENRKLPEEQWSYPDFMKTAYIDGFNDDRVLEEASEEQRAKYMSYVEELAPKGNLMALHSRCCGRYRGNAVYEQDFRAAKEDAEKLFELTRGPEYANILGCICYYGRCGGSPDYDAALKYFIYGAANGVHESICKLADMYMNGYGTWKSPETAYKMMLKLYGELYSGYAADEDEDDFADVALRMGNMKLHGSGTGRDVMEAVAYLLEAEYAAKKRTEGHDYCGDETLSAVRKCLDEAREIMPPKKNEGRVMDKDFWSVSRLLADDYDITWEAQRLESGGWFITFRRRPKPGEEKAEKVSITIPQIYYCAFTDNVSGYVEPLRDDMPLRGKADQIETGETEKGIVTVLMDDGRAALVLKGDVFDCVLTQKEEQPRESLDSRVIQFPKRT